MILIILGLAIDVWLSTLLFNAVTTDAPPEPPAVEETESGT